MLQTMENAAGVPERRSGLRRPRPGQEPHRARPSPSGARPAVHAGAGSLNFTALCCRWSPPPMFVPLTGVAHPAPRCGDGAPLRVTRSDSGDSRRPRRL